MINNQIGFTTPSRNAHSSLNPTDIAKMNPVPVFHVNGDRPEAVVRVMKMALRLPPGLRLGRRRRHLLLPQARAQRGRRAFLHSSVHV